MATKRSTSPIMLTSAISIIGSIIAALLFPFLRDYLPVVVTMIIILTGLGVLIYSKVDAINENQVELEEKIKRAGDLINIKVEIKYLKDKIFRIEEMIKNGS